MNNNNQLKPPYAQEIKLIKQYVNKDSIVLDIGAHIGSFTTFLAGIAKQVYAFEPAPKTFKKLFENTMQFTNVLWWDVAIGDKDNNNSTLYLCPTDPGMHRLYDSKWCKDGKKITVEQMKIDSIIPDTKKIDFVKLDIEGYEYHAIRGMQEVIKRDHPTIMMEWHPPSLIEAGSNPKEFYDFMLELGYNDKPRHVLLNTQIESYEELHNYTVNTPAINVLWVPK